MYEHMLKKFRESRDNVQLLPQLRVAAIAGLEKLDVCYKKPADANSTSSRCVISFSSPISTLKAST
jgi:hypothetical protein